MPRITLKAAVIVVNCEQIFVIVDLTDQNFAYQTGLLLWKALVHRPAREKMH